MIIKTVTDKKSGRIIGAQIIGERGVDKRIDIFATAITFKAKASDLFNLDLAYAPPVFHRKRPRYVFGDDYGQYPEQKPSPD